MAEEQQATFTELLERDSETRLDDKDRGHLDDLMRVCERVFSAKPKLSGLQCNED